MTVTEALRLVFTAELVLILGFMVMNTYFLTRRPLAAGIREIYFINSARFRRAWHLVIAAMTVFLFTHAMTLLDRAGVAPLRPDVEAGFLVAFASLILWAFVEIVRVFDRYIPRFGSSDEEIDERLRLDLRRHLLDRDADAPGDLPTKADVYRGRDHLGPMVGISHYRGVVLGMTRYLEQRFGHLGDALLYAVGRRVARHVAQGMLEEGTDDAGVLEEFLRGLQENQVGLPTLHEEAGVRTIRLEECALCCGMPAAARPECHYLTGLFSGLFETLLGQPVEASETRCWATGDQVCEFQIVEPGAVGAAAGATASAAPMHAHDGTRGDGAPMAVTP